MRQLTDREIAVLRAVAGNTGRDIALAVFGATTSGSRGATYLALHELHDHRLVTVDCDVFPAIWTRTEAGTDILAETPEGVAV